MFIAEIEDIDIIGLKMKVLASGEKAVNELIKVAEEAIVTDSPEDLTADKLKNAAQAKKTAIFDALEILQRMEAERQDIIDYHKNTQDGVSADKGVRGFAEKNAK